MVCEEGELGCCRGTKLCDLSSHDLEMENYEGNSVCDYAHYMNPPQNSVDSCKEHT